MKHFVISLALFYFCNLTTYAQEVNKIHLTALPSKYISVEFHPKTLFTKSYTLIDYGQLAESMFDKERKKMGVLMDNEQEMRFNSEIDVLNFLGKNGYRFIESYQNIKTDVDNELSNTNRKFILENLHYK